MKEQDASIDVLKAIAIVGVVAIHTLGFLEQGDILRTNWEKYIVLDQIFRYCVPLFVALSGFTLAKRYAGIKVDWKEFFIKRFKRTIPLYLIWSAIFVLIAYLIPSWGGFLVGASWWQVFLLGRADYHLYFVPMILCLYLSFPLVLYLTKRLKFVFLLLILILQAGFYLWISQHLDLSWREVQPFYSDQQQYIFLGSWIFYFTLGIWIAVTPFIRSGLRKAAFIGLIGVMLIGGWWAVSNARQLFRQEVDVLVATRFTRLPILIYSMGLIGSALMLRSWFLRIPKVFMAILNFLGRQSYLIYLGHTLWLRVIFGFVNQEVDLVVLVLATVVGLTGLGISYLVEKTY